jgi:DNA-binding NarL/FixJ family response regulator
VIRVGIVDDQELVRTGFRLILESEDDLEVVGEAADGQAALDMVRLERPDIVLMDVRMPVMDGVEATRRLGPSSSTKVIIVTTFDLDEYVFAALHHGASGFLLKDAPADQLISAIRLVASGEALLSPSITRRLIEHFQSSMPSLETATSRPEVGSLTGREAEVWVHLAQGLSNAEIAAALYVSETTIKTHVGRILTKLRVRDRVQAVVLAYELGVVRPGIGDRGHPSPTNRGDAR